jgi:hypothetical protein
MHSMVTNDIRATFRGYKLLIWLRLLNRCPDFVHAIQGGTDDWKRRHSGPKASEAACLDVARF